MGGGKSQVAVSSGQKPLPILRPKKQRNGSGQLVLEASSLQADYLMERFLHRR